MIAVKGKSNRDEILELLRTPEYRAQIRKQLATQPHNTEDGSQSIEVKDEGGNLIRKIKALTPKAPS